ncbi:MAG: Na/Pi cotransporter family protein [Hydrogenibacillus sp.]|nr:Na/Pi cotransporter family protein [Hydrogenibacillus sp.]
MLKAAVALLVGIIVFGFGLGTMRRGLGALTESAAVRWLKRLDGRPASAFTAGLAVTAAMQSSSASTILLVGLVGAGLLRFETAVPVVLGANVGSAITLFILGLPIERRFVPLLAISAFLMIIPRREVRAFGQALFGLLGALAGLAAIGAGARTLAHSTPELFTHLGHAAHPAEPLIAGVIVTAVIQSSTAAGAIAASWLEAGLAHLPAAVAFIIGANIGTCLDTVLAGVLSPRPGRWIAEWHVLLNVVGAVVFYPAIDLLASIVAPLPSALEQIAMAQLVFNALSAALFLPWTGTIARWIVAVDERLFPAD